MTKTLENSMERKEYFHVSQLQGADSLIHRQRTYSLTVTCNKDRPLQRQAIRRLKVKMRQDTNEVNAVNFDTEEYIDVLFSDLFRPVTQNISYGSHCG